MHKLVAGHPSPAEEEVPVDLLAGLLMEQSRAASTSGNSERVPPKVYAVMAVTSVLTFSALTTGYQLLFAHQLFA